MNIIFIHYSYNIATYPTDKVVGEVVNLFENDPQFFFIL